MDPLIGAAIGLMGLTVIGLPLATPETIGWLGYRPARRLARALGGAAGPCGGLDLPVNGGRPRARAVWRFRASKR